MGLHPGYTRTDEQKKRDSLGMARARARRSREQEKEPPAPKENRPTRQYHRCQKSIEPPIAPPAFAEPAGAPDMKRIEKAPHTKLAKLRSLEAQATALLQSVIALRRQITQLAQEVEL